VITLATASQKGGVGKTTVCVNLAYSLARRGWRTLLIDTDPQGAVGLSLARSTRQRRGFYDYLTSGSTVRDLILPTRLPELSLLPAGQYDAAARTGWRNEDVPQKVRDLLRGAELEGMDFVILDTAAGLTGLTEQVVKASDFVLLPQQSGVKVAGILLTMVMNDNDMSVQVARELRQVLPGELMFKQSIPRLPSFLEASALGVPIALLKQNPPPEALLLDQIAAELEQRTGLDRQKQAPYRHANLLD
jgi:chromosome partitioning protein